MKKLLLLFGHPGSGRKTFIDKVFDKSEVIQDTFGLDCNNVICVSLPYDRNAFISDYRSLENRFNKFYQVVENFIFSEGETLIIPIEHADYYDIQKSILKHLADFFPDLDKEILMLIPSDESIGYQRLKDTEWFQSNLQENMYKYQIEWYRFSINYVRKCLNRFNELGYKVTEVDTTDGYVIKNDSPRKVLKNGEAH